MREATLCYPIRNDEVLLIRKKRGLGEGKVVGPGGKVESGETPREAMVRETREEVGLRVEDAEKCGEFSFTLGDHDGLFVHVFRTESFAGEARETEEAIPEWFEIDEVPYDEMWAGDGKWLPYLFAGETFAGEFAFDAAGEELRGFELDVGVAFE